MTFVYKLTTFCFIPCKNVLSVYFLNDSIFLMVFPLCDGDQHSTYARNKESYTKDQNRVLSRWVDWFATDLRLHATQFNIFFVLGTIDPPTSSSVNYGNFPCGWTTKYAQLFLLKKNLRQLLGGYFMVLSKTILIFITSLMIAHHLFTLTSWVTCWHLLYHYITNKRHKTVAISCKLQNIALQTNNLSSWGAAAYSCFLHEKKIPDFASTWRWSRKIPATLEKHHLLMTQWWFFWTAIEANSNLQTKYREPGWIRICQTFIL